MKANHGLYDSVRGPIIKDLSNSDNTEKKAIVVFPKKVEVLELTICKHIITVLIVDIAWTAGKAGGNKNTFNVDDVGYASAAAAGLDG